MYGEFLINEFKLLALRWFARSLRVVYGYKLSHLVDSFGDILFWPFKHANCLRLTVKMSLSIWDYYFTILLKLFSLSWLSHLHPSMERQSWTSFTFTIFYFSRLKASINCSKLSWICLTRSERFGIHMKHTYISDVWKTFIIQKKHFLLNSSANSTCLPVINAIFLAESEYISSNTNFTSFSSLRAKKLVQQYTYNCMNKHTMRKHKKIMEYLYHVCSAVYLNWKWETFLPS